LCDVKSLFAFGPPWYVGSYCVVECRAVT